MAASRLCHSAIPRGQGNVNHDFSAVEIPSVGDLKAVVRGGGHCRSFGSCACCRGSPSSLTPAWVP